MAIQIDHVVVAGSNLTQLCAIFESIGLTPDKGGVHADGQTHNALIGFADGSYLELIAPTLGNTAPDHVWSKFMQDDAGVCAWAIRSRDIQADMTLYRSRGIEVGEPRLGGRTRPDGVRLEWITAKLGTEPLGSVLPFLIQDITPREWRTPVAGSAEGLITGVTKMLIDLKSSKGVMTEKNLADIGLLYWNENSKGVHGVILSTSDLQAVCKQYHAEIIFVWRDSLSAWPYMKQITLGFIGPMSRPPFNVDRFKRQLAETIAWCAPRTLGPDFTHTLRSSVPVMPDTLYNPDALNRYLGISTTKHEENDAARQIRRNHNYDVFFAARSQRLKDENIQVKPVEHDLAGGRLLVFDVNNCLYEGAMEPESEGFFDGIQDGPPWDTWVYQDSIADLLICWVPPELIPYVEAGMEVMTLRWCWWLTGDEDYEVAKILKREGFLG